MSEFPRLAHAIVYSLHLSLLLCLLAAAPASWAKQAKPEALPVPLTLEHALSFADRPHPIVRRAQADLGLAQSSELAVRARYGINAGIELRPRTVRISRDGNGDFQNDSAILFNVSKQLYDFGRTRSQLTAAQAQVASRQTKLIDVQAQRRIDIMARFFDVVLADLRFLADDEAMTVRFLRFDKARERHDLGMVSAVDLAELESAWRDTLVTRAASEHRQRLSRTLLVTAMYYQGELPGELGQPELPVLKRQVPEFEKLMVVARKSNPQLIAHRQRVQAAQAGVEAARATRRPTLGAEVQVAEYELQRGSRDDARATLSLRVPIYQGRTDQARIAAAEARMQDVQAELELAEFQVKRQTLELTQQLDVLKRSRQAANLREDFRDQYLDRARGLYELEVQTNLGDASAQLMEALWLSAKADYETALTWARLDALLGRRVEPFSAEATP